MQGCFRMVSSLNRVVAPRRSRRDEYGARGVDLASVVFKPPAGRRLRDPDRLLPSFSRFRAAPKSPDGRGSI
jgi:hypothetical protein